MPKLNFDKMYENYSKYYDKTKETSGVEMDTKLSKKEFQSAYLTEYQERYIDIAEGNRKTIGAISRDIVNSQKDYYLSMKQAREVKKAYVSKHPDKKAPRTRDLMKEKKLSDEFFDEIKAYSKKHGKKATAQYFFGSP